MLESEITLFAHCGFPLLQCENFIRAESYLSYLLMYSQHLEQSLDHGGVYSGGLEPSRGSDGDREMFVL